MHDRSTLGIGIVGAGFIARFHARALQAVRDVDVVAVTSRRRASAEELACHVQDLGVGDAVTVHAGVAELVADERVDAIWVLTPNDTRVEVIETLCGEVAAGRGSLRGIAAEKPLGRHLAEARRIRNAVAEAGLLHAYLENQIHAPRITRTRDLVWSRGADGSGTPYLARCCEEHSGPHSAWFWDSVAQGGGVLNDLMCHSLEAGRFLLTPTDKNPTDWLRPTSVRATTASLRWGRDHYAAELERRYPGVQDYRTTPSEDYASATFHFVNGVGEPVIVEATTSWCYVGPGMKLTFEVLGPEYSMNAESLRGDATLFLSRELQSDGTGEDLVEKQNAEQGSMPVVADEPAAYGYVSQNTQVVQDFIAGRQPLESFDSGVAVTELLMAAYKAAETETTVYFPAEVEDYIPAVAQRAWHPRQEKA